MRELFLCSPNSLDSILPVKGVVCCELELFSVAEPHLFDPAPERKNNAAPVPVCPLSCGLYCTKLKMLTCLVGLRLLQGKKLCDSLRLRLRNTAIFIGYLVNIKVCVSDIGNVLAHWYSGQSSPVGFVYLMQTFVLANLTYKHPF
jgi:hypothetical protein